MSLLSTPTFKKVMVLFLFLYAIELPPMRRYHIYVLFACAVWALFVSCDKKALFKPAAVLVVFLIVNVVFCHMNGHIADWAIEYNMVADPLIFMLIGYCAVKENGCKDTKDMETLLLVIALGGSIFVFGSLIRTIATRGTIVGSQYRFLYLMWMSSNTFSKNDTGTGWAVATGATGWALPGGALVGLLVSGVWGKTTLFQKLLCFFGTLVILALGVYAGTRTALMIVAATVIAAFLFNGQSVKTKGKGLLLMSAFALLIFLLYQFNAFSLKEFIDQSILMERVGQGFFADETGGHGRLGRWTAVIQNVFTYPFGSPGGVLKEPHNFWLETYRVGGVFCFALSIMYTVSYFKTLVKFIRGYRMQPLTRVLLISETAACFLFLAVEIIFWGNTLPLFTITLMHGMMIAKMADGQPEETTEDAPEEKRRSRIRIHFSRANM